MTETTYFCDHCGKNLDELEARRKIEIDLFFDEYDADLCAECRGKLEKKVREFLNWEDKQ